MAPKAKTPKSPTKRIAESKLNNLSEVLKNTRTSKAQKIKKLESYSVMYEKAIKRKKEVYKKLFELAKKDPKKVVGLEEFDLNLFLDSNKNFSDFFRRLRSEINALEKQKRTIQGAIAEIK